MILTGTFGCTPSGNPGQEGTTPAAKPGAEEKKIEIVTTIFPEYDWVREIVGDANPNVHLTLLQDGVDLHSYQPSVADILKIASSDLFLYVGGESDEWVDEVLEQNPNEGRKVIDLMETLGEAVKTEEMVEGMQAEEHHHHFGDEDDHDHEDEEHDHDHDDHDHDHGEEEEEYDEHVWLSLKNAKVLVSAIADAVIAADGDHAEQYRANRDAYLEKLSALDEEYAKAASEKNYDTILFADRFPFRYLMDDYEIRYYAAFNGCAAETEASFETIRFLADKVNELRLPAVCMIENSDGKIADTVIAATKDKDQEKVVMNSLQSVSKKDQGLTYLEVMQENLKGFRKALGVLIPDVDLTDMSSTLVYASVYNMMNAPEEYKGKCIRMSGTFYNFYDEYTEDNINACLIADATACCQQGVEFVLVDPSGYPEDLSPVTVTGIFETYEKNGYLLCRVDHAVLSAN